ncbi:hypothetical protein DTO217A2_5565 [Paecilomyces variotii]|nr:hypothetical protein DTO217A2_5565 [Paecilomyces variotii]KAJ9372484.1 hypothetical protein DTO282E5_2811 [Paecilomyces variotii]
MGTPSGQPWLSCIRITNICILQRSSAQLFPRWTRSRSERVLDRLRVPSTATDKEGRILPDSLEKTLHVHRAANRARLLRKVAYDRTSPDVFRPLLSKKSPPDEQREALKQKGRNPSTDACAPDAEKTSLSDRDTNLISASASKSSVPNRPGESARKQESVEDGQSRDAGQG